MVTTEQTSSMSPFWGAHNFDPLCTLSAQCIFEPVNRLELFLDFFPARVNGRNENTKYAFKDRCNPTLFLQSTNAFVWLYFIQVCESGFCGA